MQVDPLVDVVAIPPGACLGLDDHYAMSTNAVRQMLVQDVERETSHRLDLAKCQAAAQISDARAKAAIEAAEGAEFWQRWGPVVGAAIGILVGAAVPTAVLFLTR